MAAKRSIFEEVGAAQATVAPQGGLIDGRGKGARRGIRVWLVLLFLLVATMIAVGGLTRLTDSGLSITEWKPVTGAIPPLNEADWAVGFFGFLVAGKIPVGWKGRLFGIGVLGGAQGAIGWWMVSSGLTGSMVDVASYRLATHLGLAFVILGLIAGYVFLLGRTETDLLVARRSGERKLFGLSTGLMHFAFLQVVLGALVAGIDAGRGFPTWPDMNGQFFPADAFYVPGRPAWAAFFENPGLVQFIHRMSGYLLFVFGVVVWLRGRKSAYRATQGAFHAVMAVMLAQVVLGIFTALTAAQAHVAITHQIGAVFLWVLIIRARHLSAYPVAGSIREGTA